jgi:Endonuclease/Exonuclease/phosphatase family
VTIPHDSRDYPVLFLHLKAADEAIDVGVRIYQHDKARSLRQALDQAADAGERANFIVAGDINNVGMSLTFSDRDISLDDERNRIKKMYESQFDRMRLLPKTAPATFWNGPASGNLPSDIDHVLAASQVTFNALADGARVEVKGWPEEPSDGAKVAWIVKYSDHAMLRFTVTGVA